MKDEKIIERNEAVEELSDDAMESISGGKQITITRTGYTCKYCGQKHSLSEITNPPCEEGRKALNLI